MLQLLISEACYIRSYAMCFSDVYFSGPCSLMGLGAGFWWLRLLLTFTCSWKEPPAPLLLSGSGRNKPKQSNGRLGWRDHRHDAHVSWKIWRKQGTHAVCQLLHSLGHPNCQYYPLCYWWNYFLGGNTAEKIIIYRPSGVTYFKSGFPFSVLAWVYLFFKATVQTKNIYMMSH